MPRPERFTPAGVPVHVTQRGNFRAPVFSCDENCTYFLRLLGRYSREYGNRVVGYCLMGNHYHLVVIPDRDESVSEMMQALNATYSRTFNEALGRTGHAFQGRFGSASLSLAHYRVALGYVDLNPVRAGMVRDATEFVWSSAAAHAWLVAPPPFLDMREFRMTHSAEDWRVILGREESASDLSVLRKATLRGSVSGSVEFVRQMEVKYGRALMPKPVGRPKKVATAAATSH